MKKKWKVDIKCTTKKETKEFHMLQGNKIEDSYIPYFSDVEISVLRENNKHGVISYGWDDKDKIILFGNEEECTKEEMKWWKQVAKVFCNALNKAGL